MLIVRELLRNDLLAISSGLLGLPEAYSITELERHLSQGDLVLGLDSEVVGFALVRCVSDEAELLLLSLRLHTGAVVWGRCYLRVC